MYLDSMINDTQQYNHKHKHRRQVLKNLMRALLGLGIIGTNAQFGGWGLG
jgi:ribosomal protein L17